MHARLTARYVRALVGVAGLTWSTRVVGQTTNIWDGDSGNGWGVAANWVDNIAYGSQVVIFYNPGALNLNTLLGSDRNAHNLIFNDEADNNVSISGANRLRLFAPTGTGLVVRAGADGNHFIGCTAIEITNNQIWHIETANGSLTVGPVRGGPAYTVTKTGAGLLILSNSVVDLGNFIVSEGTVRYIAGNGFHDNNTRVTVQSGAILDKNHTGIDAFRALLGSGVVSNWTGTLQLRPQDGESSLFSGTLYQGTSAANLQVTLDSIGASRPALDGSDNSTQAFDALVPFTGQIQAHNGILALQGANGAAPNIAVVVIGQNNRGTRTPTLLLDSSGANHTSQDRLPDTVPVRFDGPGQLKLVGNWIAGTSETIGIITQINGRAIVTLDADSGGATTLTAARWDLPNTGRIALIRGDNLGGPAGPDVAQLLFTTPPALSHIGGVGDQIGIIPFMAGDTNIAGEGSGLVTYDASTGVRLLTLAEYASALTPDRNVRLTGPSSIAANTRIRALYLDEGGVANLNGNLLVLDSQAMFLGGGTITNGSLAFGTNTTGTASIGHVHAISNTVLGASLIGLPNSLGESKIAFSGPATVTLVAPGTNWTPLLSGGVTLKTAASEVIPEGTMANDEGHLWIGDGLRETTGYLRGFGKSQITIGTNSILVINQTSTESFYGLIHGPESAVLVKAGVNTLSIRETATNFLGRVFVTNGILEFIDSAGRMAAASTIQFFVTNSTLELDNQPGTDTRNQNDRIHNDSPVYLSAGSFVLRGSRNANTAENIGDMIFQGGMNTIVLDRDNTSPTPDNSATLNPNVFVRTNGATLFIDAEQLAFATNAAWTRLYKDDTLPAPLLTHPYVSNSPTIGIVHWAYGRDLGSAVWATNWSGDEYGFVTYDDGGSPDLGFRFLQPAEYNTNTLASGGNVIVRIATNEVVLLQNNSKVQGLVLNKYLSGTAEGGLNLSNFVLHIESAMLASGTNQSGSVLTIRRSGSNGALMFGNSSNNYEAVIHATRRLDVFAPIMDNIVNDVTNSTSLIKSGPAELVLRVADGAGGAQFSTYSGDTYVNAGILRLEGTSTWSYTSFNVIPTNTRVFINSRDATLEFWNAGQTIAGLYGYGRVHLNSGGNTTNRLVINYTDTNEVDRFDGWFADGAANRHLEVVKTGAGTLELTGGSAASTHRGRTIIAEGELRMNGQHIRTDAAATWIVLSNATLSGTGLIRTQGGVIVTNFGRIAPGASAGTLTIDANLVLSQESVLLFELNGTDQSVGGGVNDLIDGVNNLTLDGILEVTPLASFAGASIGDYWTLIRYDNALTDNVLDISPATQSLLTGGKSFAIDTSVANEIRLVIVPEPSTLGLFGLVAVGLLLRRRLRG